MRALFIAPLTLALLAGCGTDSTTSTGDGPEAVPAADASVFPEAGKRTLTEFIEQEGENRDAPVLTPGGMVARPGTQRFSFALFTIAREQVSDVDEVALYVARGADGTVTGPYPARRDPLTTEARFRSKTAGEEDAEAVYVSDVEFEGRGESRVAAVVRRGDTNHVTRPISVVVRSFDRIPAAGDRAPKVGTPTVSDVADVSAIDTRQPPTSMHDTDLSKVLGRKPVVLLFATPALCQTRVCGPVADVTEQVKQQTPGDEVQFIHMEIYKDNDVAKGLRPQVQAYGLPTEPWVFVTDRKGVVRTAIEGAFGVDELKKAVAEVR